MKRINVTGNAGVGKSTLAAQITSRLGFPVFGLDAIKWQPGWRRAPESCPEIRILPTLAGLIWGFPRRVRPALLAELQELRGEKTVVHLCSDAELGAFLRRLAHGGPPLKNTPDYTALR